MFRLIFYLLLTVVLISLLRGVIGTLARAFSIFVQASGGGNKNTNRPRQFQVPLTGELKRDPVCGTYISAATSLKVGEGPKTVYFCSGECRDKYLMSAHS